MVRVVTLGHILMDLRFCVDEFATPDRESVIRRQSRGVGGSAANVAIGVRRLGGTSTVIGKIGFDGFGKAVLEDLARESVNVSNVRIEALEGRTGFTIVIIDAEGRIIMYGFKGVADMLLPDEINPKVLGGADFLHIASIRLDTAVHAARLARERGVKVSWDPGRVQAAMGLEKLKPIIGLSHIVLPNEKEARLMTGEEDYKAAAQKILEAGAETVVVKLGGRGAYVATREESFHVPPYLPGKVVDTTGAGDAFAAGLLVGLEKYDLRGAARYAAVVAGIKVTRLGSHEIPRAEEIEQAIFEEHELEDF